MMSSRASHRAHLREKWRVIADELLDRYGITGPEHLDVEALAEATGVKIVHKPIAGAEGRLVSGRKGARIVVDAGIRLDGKRRFVVAHELGHFLQKNRRSQGHVCLDASLISLYQDDPQETEANVFAAELLMPDRWVALRFRGKQPSFGIVRSAADALRTTLTATAVRLVELAREPVALVASKDGKIEWHSRSSDSWYYRLYTRGTVLSKWTCAYDLFAGRPEEPKPTLVSAEAWFDMPNLKDDAEIYEHSIKLGSYPMVLSLLWVDKEPTYPLRRS